MARIGSKENEYSAFALTAPNKDVTGCGANVAVDPSCWIIARRMADRMAKEAGFMNRQVPDPGAESPE